MLPWRDERVGDDGSSAGRFTPLLGAPLVFDRASMVVVLPFGWSDPFVASVCSSVAAAFAGSLAFTGSGSSLVGDGGGGGISVPSVSAANLNSRAGSSNF